MFGWYDSGKTPPYRIRRSTEITMPFHASKPPSHFHTRQGQEVVNAEPEPKTESRRPSKTKAKEEMDALQELGKRLVEVSNDRLKKLDIPEILADAVREAKRISSFGALRRQMQYIGKLMRKVDADALAQAIELDAVAQRQPELAAPKQQRVWAEKLLAEDGGAEALQSFIAQQPQADIQQLRSLLRQATKLQASARELQNAQPPQPDKAYAEYRAAKRAAKKLQAFIAQVLGQEEAEAEDEGEGEAL